jgi:hypothetical protein
MDFYIIFFGKKEMSLIVAGRVVGLVILLVAVISILYYMWMAGKGKLARIRRLPQVDVIDEIIARCVEMNKELWFLSGQGYMTNTTQLPGILSTFGILSYVTRKCAEVGCKIHHPSFLGVAYNIQYEIMREAYEAAGKPEEFDPLETVIYVPMGAGRPYVCTETWRRKPAGGILCGFWYHYTIIYSEALQRAGAMTLGGTDTTHNIPFMVAANDYSMIGEEMYAMSAYLSKDPVLTSSLAGQDVGKYLAIIMTIIGVLLGAAGVPVANWFKM